MRENDYLELYELQQIIREGVEEAVPGPVRVRAEIASLQQRANGHCYMELSQSGISGPVAKVRAVIWRSQVSAVLGKFADATGGLLKPGVSVIFEVLVNYSELYGLTLVIEDVDVEHTLGEAELRRRETLERLEKEELLDLQKELALPDVPYRLAVISAEDAAGYGDFRRHLMENEYGFAFDVTLFPATMQGDSAPASIIASLNRVAAALRCSSAAIALHDGERKCGGKESFDAVLILRGGGSTLDLSCFDDYDLCAAIARFPIPVFTAIGHDRDSHIADIVACDSVKTPTALADMFIDTVAAEDERISSFQGRLKLAFVSKLSLLEAAVQRLETRIAAANPRRLLERGYTLITDGNGVLVKRAADVKAGDEISVLYQDGTLKCTVNGKV